jgi:YbbR domain-containing protein
MPFIKLSKAQRRKSVMFISCLMIAMLAWLFFALSNQYVYSLKTVVHYTNLPQNKAFHPLQSDTVNLNVEGTGWKLLFSKLRLEPEAVKVDLKSLSNRNYVIFKEQLPYINRTFHSTQRIVSVAPDTLYFDFSSRSVRRIPVELLYKVSFKSGYEISDSIKINPSKVTVTGPLEEINHLKKWETDTLSAIGVQSAINARVALQRPRENNITIYPSIVEVKIPVAEFTEKMLELPVIILNGKPGTHVKLLPSRIKITFLTPLTNYPNINRDHFEAAVDLDNWSKKGYSQLPVVLKKIPPFCKILKIEPQTIDFIIK